MTGSTHPDTSAAPAGRQKTPQPSEHNAMVVACSGRELMPHEIRWDCKLFDSDGYEHTLIQLGAVQVVTKYSFAFAVWDRKTGLSTSHEGAVIGNIQISEADRQAKYEAEMNALSWEQSQPPFLESCPSVARLLKAVEGALAALPRGSKERASLMIACAPFREGVAAAYYGRGDMETMAAEGTEVPAEVLDRALVLLVEQFPHPWDEMAGFLRLAQEEQAQATPAVERG